MMRVRVGWEGDGHAASAWARASAMVKGMWAAHSYRFQPYQYEKEFLVLQTDESLRPLVASERERPHGFVTGHDLPLLAKPHDDRERQAQEDLRCAAVGNGVHCVLVARLLAHIAKGGWPPDERHGHLGGMAQAGGLYRLGDGL